MKAQKLSRVNPRQDFVSRGWNIHSSQFDLKSAEDIEYDIKYSPSRPHRSSNKRFCVEESFPKKKPMLVEISNIESVFKERKIKSPERKQTQNYNDFKKNLFKNEKFPKNYPCKLRAKSLNFNDLKESFQTNNQHINKSLYFDHNFDLITDYSPGKKNELRGKHTSNLNKLRKIKDAFNNNSFIQNYIEKDAYSRNEDSVISEEIKTSKVTTLHCSSKPKEENDVSSNLCYKNCVNENITCKNLNRKSCTDVVMSPKKFFASTCMPCMKEENILVSNCSSNSNIDSNNAIDADPSPDQNGSSIILSMPQSEENDVSSSLCYKNFLSENIICKNLNHKSSTDIVKSPKMFFGSTCMPCMEEENILVSNYSINSNIDSNNVIDEGPSPDQNGSSIIFSMPQFENPGMEVSKSEHKIPVEMRSVIIDKKAFVRSEQSSWKGKCSSVDKGSNWVQSLKWADITECKDSYSDNNNQTRKKGVKSVVHGGFSEQMLKLQRRERSDRVIWNHKINELKKKAAASSVTFSLASVLHIGQIIITKCYASEQENEKLKNIALNDETTATHLNTFDHIFKELNNISDDGDMQDARLKPFLILFKKITFLQLNLKVKDMFTLYMPWQMLSGTSLPFPVLMCTYYVEALNKSGEIPNISSGIQSQLTTYCSLENELPECNVLKFSNSALFYSLDLYGRNVCISARVQRIWKSFVLNDRVHNMVKYEKFLGFSLLLQSKEGIFLELKINSNEIPESFHKFLSDAEGLCFKFCDVLMTHRYDLRKIQDLSKIIEHVQTQKENNIVMSPQIYFCQFIPSSLDKMPKEVSEENFPVYSRWKVKPLSFVQKNNLYGLRVSCIGKVLFQSKSYSYISDESLLVSKHQKFIQLHFASPSQNQLIVGANVLIKEAVVKETCLLIDKFSSWEFFSSVDASKLSIPLEPRLKKISLITSGHVLSPLSLTSKASEFVLVNGTIIQVNENSAISWLECSQCSGENLLEDSKCIIYCENCSCIVTKPILKLKMEVTVSSADLSSAKVKIQLQSSTIKRILNICEDNYKPQCNISDVYKKSSGNLSCFIKDIEIVNKQMIFHLLEVVSC